MKREGREMKDKKTIFLVVSPPLPFIDSVLLCFFMVIVLICFLVFVSDYFPTPNTLCKLPMTRSSAERVDRGVMLTVSIDAPVFPDLSRDNARR